jgi:hypothetical protein
MPATRRIEVGFTISPHTRGIMTRKVADGKQWRGTRNGIRIEIQKAKQMNFTRNRIEWRARINGDWHNGHAETVWEAVRDIEAAAARIAAATDPRKVC